MLDLTTLHAQLNAATDNLATTLADLLAGEAMRLRTTSAAQAAERQEAAAPPAPASVPSSREASAAPSRPRPLLNRPNVHVVPSKPKVARVVPFTSTSLYEPVVRKEPPPEEIAKKAERLVCAASMPPTFERLRKSLRVTKAALQPVIEQLVAENKIRIVELGDVVLYEPPRIEPIRRRRRELNVAARA